MNELSGKEYQSPGHSRPAWLSGVMRAAPIVLGYLPVGFAFGVLARKAGLSEFNTVMMSVLVYAGAAQLISVSLFAAGLSPITIIITTFIVNLRHLVMASALAPYLKRWTKAELAAFSYQMTDETFAVHCTSLPSGSPTKAEVYATNITAQSAWVAGTALGVIAGELIADARPLALDYALPAMFIALLVMQIKNRRQIMVAIIAGLMSVLLLQLGMKHWNIIVATIIAATCGVFIEPWIRKASS